MISNIQKAKEFERDHHVHKFHGRKCDADIARTQAIAHMKIALHEDGCHIRGMNDKWIKEVFDKRYPQRAQ